MRPVRTGRFAGQQMNADRLNIHAPSLPSIRAAILADSK
jgi:hypothetical protein